MSSSKTPIRTVACVAGLGLVLVQVALAADKQPIKFNASDQAAAKAITIKAADLGAGWKGGAAKPDLTPGTQCAMKVSDLVITGAARSEFQAPGVIIHSDAQVLQSPGMVSADWSRSIGNAQFMSCSTREVMSTTAMKVISFKKVTFAKTAQYGARYRTIAGITKAGSSVRILIDMIFLGQGRSEISLVVSTPYGNRAAIDRVERNLALILAGRVQA